MKVLLAFAVVCGGLTGCAQPKGPSPQELAIKRMEERHAQRTAEIMAEPYIDRSPEAAAWKVSCDVDSVSTVRVCRAAAFARSVTNSGTLVGSSIHPVSVYYIGTSGPMLQVETNIFPGEVPTVRIDDNPPIRLAGKQAHNNAVAQIRKGTILRASYHQWPDQFPRIQLDISGASAALDGLDRLQSQR